MTLKRVGPKCACVMGSVLLQGSVAAGTSIRSSVLRLEGELELCYEAACLQFGQASCQVRIRVEDVLGAGRTVSSFYLTRTSSQKDTIDSPPERVRIHAECLQGAAQVTVFQVSRDLPTNPPNLDLVPGSLLYVNADGYLDTLPVSGTSSHYIGTNSSGAFGHFPLEAGGVGNHLHVCGEVPVGSLDGVNRMFTLAMEPDPPMSLLLIKNGLVYQAGVDYVLSGKSIELTRAPSATSSLVAHYQVSL